MKNPPERSGIDFRVGAQLEARDRQKNWYSATIETIDYDQERVLVHYKQWSRRHNEWFHWSSPYLRPLERVSLRRRGLNPAPSQPMFVSGARVLACWTDCRFYPAKILRVNKDDSYTVRFYDGVVRTVKPTKIKPFQRKVRAEKSALGSEGWEEEECEEVEDGAEGEEEDEEEEKKEDHVKEKDASVDRDDERKRSADASPSYLPAKKKTDENRTCGPQSQPITADYAPTGAANPNQVDRDVLLQRQAHLPTTHKFSREPLYRVIKNQPPPILSIELDHNPFKCPSPGCSKSFRKASLLHYHTKYYHSEQLLGGTGEAEGILAASGGGEQDATRRKSCASEGEDFILDRRSEGQNNICHRDNREHNIMGTEGKKNGGKDRKNFLRVKLKKKKKKKKKKKTHTGLCSSDDENSDRLPITLKLSSQHHSTHTADDGSDWSTLTAESGEDTPSWQVAMEMEDCEVVRCVCEVDEENDFMIQCESCLCWQHGTCMGLYEDNVPHNYICYYCRQTAGWRRAQHVLMEPDWLMSGHMFGLSCVKGNYSQINSSKVSHTARLLAHTHTLQQAVRGLQLKINLLRAPSHPDLQLWRLPWRQEEARSLPCNPKGEPSVCYVSSEHCYQKPGASREKEEEEEEEEHTMKDVKPEEVEKKVTNNVTDAHAVTYNPTTNTESHSVAPRCPSEVECRLNLLNHVESMQRDINSRMELMERELDVLESWLDHSGELEPPDPLSRLPQLKQRIRRLLSDLCIVRQLAVCR
ncbi:unnamed protein product [Ophioblennius macclurei]